MTFFKVNPEDTSSFTIITEPKRKFVRKIGNPTVGEVSLYNRRGNVEKTRPSNFNDLNFPVDYHGGEDLTSDRIFFANKYLKDIDDLPVNSSKQFTIRRYTPNTTLSPDEIKRRFGPTTSQGQETTNYLINYFDESFQKKWIIQDLLEPFHFGESDWSYPNYHSLNFYDQMCLLYPNKDDRYNLGDSFTIDFRIKIPYRSFSEGVVIQSPGNFTVSAIPSSGSDLGNLFGIKFEIKGSTFFNNLPPLISRNKWHRVTIVVNQRNIKLYIDNSLKKESFFYQNTSSYLADVLSVGASCNKTSNSDYKSLFKNGYCSPRGISFLSNDTNNSADIPPGITFSNYLNAEIHDLIVYKKPINLSEILETSKEISGLRKVITIDGDSALQINDDNSFGDVSFFLGPYYVSTNFISEVETSFKKDISGILLTPFGEIVRGVLQSPFNLNLSFGCAGHLINIENFIGDVVNNFSIPRIVGLSININEVFRDNNSNKSCDDYLKNNILRNIFVFPCDDGDFSPNFKVLSEKISTKINNNINLEFKTSVFNERNPLFEKNFTELKLDYGLIPIPGKIGTRPFTQGDKISRFISEQNSLNSYRELALNQWKTPLILRDLTKDSTSNQVVIFEISNLFYGKRIKPGTFIIRDLELSKNSLPSPAVSSLRKISITLKDDGRGNLYRVDCVGNHSTWNVVGRIFYSEGLVVIKNPHLYFFGSEGFEVEFKGEQNIHTLKIEVIAPQNALNASTNDPDQVLLPSSDPSDKDSKFVLISGINFHDKDYNIVAKTQLAQPIVKRHEDRIMFRIQMDF